MYAVALFCLFGRGRGVGRYEHLTKADLCLFSAFNQKYTHLILWDMCNHFSPIYYCDLTVSFVMQTAYNVSYFEFYNWMFYSQKLQTEEWSPFKWVLLFLWKNKVSWNAVSQIFPYLQVQWMVKMKLLIILLAFNKNGWDIRIHYEKKRVSMFIFNCLQIINVSWLLF